MSNIYIRHRLGEGFFRQAQSRPVMWDTSRECGQQPLRRLADQESSEAVVSAGENVRQQEPLHGEPTPYSWLTVIYASVVWAGTTYIVRIHRIYTAGRVINGEGHTLVFLRPALFRCGDCTRRRRSFDCPRFVRPLRIFGTIRYCAGLTEHGSSSPSPQPSLHS